MDLPEITIDTMIFWPATIKRLFLGGLYIVLIVLGYCFDTSNQYDALSVAQDTEIQLREKFEIKQQAAANLEAYKSQLNTIKAYFHTLLRQLPAGTEVPGLVEDISHIGLAKGLSFKFIKLQPEKSLEFYSELPIEIAVSGNYHQLAKFVSDIALLPRIVTIEDFIIKDEAKTTAGSRLEMTVTAKTYRYTAEEVAVQPIEPLQKLPQNAIYIYSSAALRNPFEQQMPADDIDVGAGNGVRPDAQRIPEPLEAFPLDSLKMVGTLQQGEVISAIIKDRNGNIYRVKNGNYLGKNFGSIKNINPDEIQITEIITDGGSGWREREATLVLGE